MSVKSSTHDLITDIKRVACLIGHAPSRREYLEHGEKTKHSIEAAFGSWAAAKIACGLQGAEIQAAKPKVTAEDIFGRDIREVLAKPEPSPIARKQVTGGTVFIPDTHFPFVSSDVLMAIYEYVDRVQPERVIQLGDLYDMFSHSKFPRSRNIYNPHDEMNLGFEMARTMWATIRKLAPQAECQQILGNHDARPLKRILEAYPEGEIFFSIDRFFQFDGVKTTMDPREPLDFGRYLVLHGSYSGIGSHVRKLGRSVVHGHSHKGGHVAIPFGGKVLHELDCGLAGDPFSKVLGYTPLKVLDVTPGFGVEDQDGLRFISV